MDEIKAFVRALCLARIQEGERPLITAQDLWTIPALVLSPEEVGDVDWQRYRVPSGAELDTLRSRLESIRIAGTVPANLSATQTAVRLIGGFKPTGVLPAEELLREFARYVLTEMRAEGAGPTTVEVPTPQPAGTTSRDATSWPDLGEGLAVNLVRGAGEPVDLRSVNENVANLVRACRRRRRRAVVLLAPRGMGKTFTVEQLAARVRAGQVPAELQGVPVYKVVFAAVVGGTVGETGRNLVRVFEEAARAPRAILFFDEIQGLVAQGNPGHHAETTTALKEILASSAHPNVSIVAATTRHEFDVIVRADPALERRLTPLQIRMPEGEEETAAVRLQAETIFGAIPVPDRVVARSLEHAKRHFPSRPAIDCALDLLDGTRARISDGPSEEEIAEALEEEGRSQRAGRRVDASLDSVGSLIERLDAAIVGQPHVIHALRTSFEQSLLGLGADRGPRDVLLFAGPPGVGKTWTAKVYAEALGAGPLVHLHMGEYAHPENGPFKLVGGAAVYKNAERGGVLVNAVRDRPDAVVLLDEIDQASEPVQELLYKILDEGEIQDGFGNSVSFRGVTLLLTTNRGYFDKVRGLGFGATATIRTPITEMGREEVLERLKGDLKDGFRSRIRNAVAFTPLSRVNLGEIASMRISGEAGRLQEKTGLRLEVAENVGDLLAIASGVHDDARAMEDFLRHHLWPRLNRVLLWARPRWPELTALRLEAELPVLDRKLRVLLLDDRAEEESRRLDGLSKEIELVWSDGLAGASPELSAFDLVLLDLDWGNGPEDGLKTLRRIVQTGAATPVCIYSALGDHDLRTTYFQEGATGFILKSDGARLVRTLDQLRRETVIRSIPNAAVAGLRWTPGIQGDALVVRLGVAA